MTAIVVRFSVVDDSEYLIVNVSRRACVGCSPTPSPALMTGLRALRKIQERSMSEEEE